MQTNETCAQSVTVSTLFLASHPLFIYAITRGVPTTSTHHHPHFLYRVGEEA
jgi:hypothetical protein